jgi:hypothetical protein
MIPLAEVRELLGYADDEPSDAVLADLIRRAIARIEARTGRYFGLLEPVTEIIRGTHCRAWRHTSRGCRPRRLYLTDLPTGTGYEGESAVDVAIWQNDEPVEELTAFMVRQQGVEAWLERTDGGWWDMAVEYHVQYVRGYAEGGLPDDIRDFVLQWISRRMSTMGSEALASESIGGYAYTMARDQSAGLDELEATIARWIRPVIA